MRKLLSKTDEVVNKILNLSGKKIVTVCSFKGINQFDIKEDGSIGYDPSHEILFKLALQQALITPDGSVIIRQFLNSEFDFINPDGDKIEVPYKNVYTLVSNGEYLVSLNSEQAMYAHCFDAETGKIIDPEVGVSYVELPLP